MKSIIIIASLAILGLVFFEGLTNYVSKSSIEGKYTNNNTDYILEGPNPISQGVDTLVIKKDNTFDSQTWGSGTYEVKPSVFGTRIQLTYDYEMGKAGREMLVTSPLFRPKRIWLDMDLNYYFEKTNMTELSNFKYNITIVEGVREVLTPLASLILKESKVLNTPPSNQKVIFL